jgi:hypothetical protein
VEAWVTDASGLTRLHSVPYTPVSVRVLLALFTAAALFSARLDAAQLHVHVSDHAHQHQHGLAAHAHEATARTAASSTPQLTGDDGQHAVHVTLQTVTIDKVKAPAVHAVVTARIEVEGIAARLRRIVEVRVHGPPPHDNLPLRAPPAPSLS